MTTTTGDPSTLKTPASLSGGDLVSRLLAATPPYLYNVPLTPHSFFFSEMLRSFVQAKTEASSAGGGGGGGGGGSGGGGNSVATNAPRRRKRSWRDARDRPLELTTKERPHHHHHHHYHQHSDKYYHSTSQQQPPQVPPETRLENDGKRSDAYLDTLENKVGAIFEQKPNFGGDILKPIDENKTEFPRQHGKNFFDERPRHFEQAQPPENGFPGGETPRKIKPEDSQQLDRIGGRNYEDRSKNIASGQEVVSPLQLSDQKKLDFSRAGPFLPGMPGRGCEGVLQGVKGFALPGGVSSPAEFLPGPLWYPPYPMPQSYPGIDPLHFFIDLRVSGHIWDRKHANERQLSFKSKHCSAFSVPQSKECGNRPLNLTRDEAVTSKSSEAENTRGTNYILKHLMKTYQEIQRMKTSRIDASMENEENSKETQQVGEDTTKVEDSGSTATNSEEERKDLRALIGLELVVDYVKEPKDDSSTEQTSQVTE
ncbi:uncharacterized protein LOC105207662 isoform X2 [Solenopsis invicta]|nr:uncharacterized protein LOC105207662 isoform X2 [Solenopsis invicta]